MSSNAFCTIVTFDYLPYVLALHNSIQKFQAIELNVLISDKKLIDLKPNEKHHLDDLPATIQCYCYDQLSEVPIGREIFNKYWASDMDCYRWSMKAVFLKYLLEIGKYNKVIYADSDLYFFSDYSFLFDELNDYNILLTPHWRSSDPQKDPGNFNLLFVGGLFNGGFIGVNKCGIQAMEWWGNVCLIQCIRDFSKGHYVDQTYLNLFPVLFDKVQILKHKGCNIANWNRIDCPRKKVNQIVTIDSKWPIVFIHFTGSTIGGIDSGNDNLLSPYLAEYRNTLSRYGVELKKEKKEKKKTSYITNVKQKLKRAIR